MGKTIDLSDLVIVHSGKSSSAWCSLLHFSNLFSQCGVSSWVSSGPQCTGWCLIPDIRCCSLWIIYFLVTFPSCHFRPTDPVKDSIIIRVTHGICWVMNMLSWKAYVWYVMPGRVILWIGNQVAVYCEHFLWLLRWQRVSMYDKKFTQLGVLKWSRKEGGQQEELIQDQEI